ncbi:unnamed protein product [Brachionus calyciflorus]|uniref:FAD-binding domain-containing protein n=1 Tax=Brachionus calyciflorus TaxID=104777 RepID=A0A814FQN7_9BILA|nr:unnamed protein product [Brachionus calyciflorus]
MECDNSKKVLIIGAGPVGLAAAVFLKHKGIRPRIVDKILEPTEHSKAMAINPRTQEIFDKINSLDEFLQKTYRLRSANFHRGTQLIIKNTFDKFEHKFPYMTIQTQKQSERVLIKMLSKRGIEVERGVSVNRVSNIDNSVQVELTTQNGEVSTEVYDYVFCADGAHSASRKSLGLKFDGSSIGSPWYLFDVKLNASLKSDEMFVYIFKFNFLFMLCIEDNLWRVFSNDENILDYLPGETSVESVEWRSNFVISHRVIERFNVGNIYFGGDAAHVHSPAGGRGMNLGIEDAYVFTELLISGRLDEYDKLRMKVVKETVAKVDRFTNIVSGKTFTTRLIRTIGLYILPYIFPFIRKSLTTFLFGLDHELLS